MNVALIGMGPGGADTLLPGAVRRLEEAELILGAARLLEALPPCGARTVRAVRPEELLACLRERGPARAAVVFSGDTGFFSGAARFLTLLRREEPAAQVEVFPGISSLQTFAARLGRPWQDWSLCSAHGTRCDIPAELKKGRPLFLLTGGASDPARICRELTEAGLGDCPVTVGQALSYPQERIVEGPARELTALACDPVNVVLVDPQPELLPRLRTPGIPDGDFIRGAVPMTKQEVRAAVLGKLGVTPGDLCWDIGAGTGSVSVELAMACRAVYAVERDEAALALIGQNRRRFRTWNLRVVPGAAPETLAGLPRPDAVFVGGSGGALTEILEAALAANPRVRLCVSAIAMETAMAALGWMEARGLEPELCQLAVSRGRRAGDLHLLMANNPVYLITGAGT